MKPLWAAYFAGAAASLARLESRASVPKRVREDKQTRLLTLPGPQHQIIPTWLRDNNIQSQRGEK